MVTVTLSSSTLQQVTQELNLLVRDMPSIIASVLAEPTILNQDGASDDLTAILTIPSHIIASFSQEALMSICSRP